MWSLSDNINDNIRMDTTIRHPGPTCNSNDTWIWWGSTWNDDGGDDTKKLLNITFEREIDEYPDLSYLGEITYQKRKPISENNEAWIPINPDDVSEGWFSPCNHLPHNPRNWDHVQGETRQQIIDKYGSLRKADIAYAYEDLHRLQEYEKMHWWMEVYTLEAHIAVSDDGKHWAHDTIWDSLGGIESDGIQKEYQETILQDMKMNLMHDLEVWGFERWEIMNALCKMEES